MKNYKKGEKIKPAHRDAHGFYSLSLLPGDEGSPESLGDPLLLLTKEATGRSPLTWQEGLRPAGSTGQSLRSRPGEHKHSAAGLELLS